MKPNDFLITSEYSLFALEIKSLTFATISLDFNSGYILEKKLYNSLPRYIDTVGLDSNLSTNSSV